MSGKGSSPRPMPNPDKYRDNFDLIFGKKDEKPTPTHPASPIPTGRPTDSGGVEK